MSPVPTGMDHPNESVAKQIAAILRGAGSGLLVFVVVNVPGLGTIRAVVLLVSAALAVVAGISMEVTRRK